MNFLMEYEHFTYPEAIRFLAKRYHIEIEEEVETAEQIQEKNEKESLFLLNQFAQKYFTGNLFVSIFIKLGKQITFWFLSAFICQFL